QRTGTVGSRHDLCRVPGPSAGKCDLEVDARDSLYRLDHFEHGETTPVTAIERGGDATAAQIRQRIAMRAHEIGHVNVVSDAGAVRCRVVGAEDTTLGRRPSAVSNDTLTMWVALLVDWPVRPSGSAPATLK